MPNRPRNFNPNFIYLIKHNIYRKSEPFALDNVVTLNNTEVDFESQLPKILEKQFVAIVIYMESPSLCLNYLRNYLQLSQTYLFVIVFNDHATEDATFRWSASELGAHMVTNSFTAAASALSICMYRKQGTYSCPFCEMTRFDEVELREHVSLFHESHKQNLCCTCPICKKMTRNFFRHIFHDHGDGVVEERTGLYSICIVQRPSDKSFLMVQERGSAGFWVPGGGLNPGESYVKGAFRETLEEAGVFIDIKGILQFESASRGHWKRVVFYAEPKDENQIPKTMPDFESNGACWVKYDQLKYIKLRNMSEPMKFFRFVLDGGHINPLEIPQSETRFYNKDPPLM